MSLANLMKKGSLRRFATVTVATTATVRPDSPPSVASVATVTVATAQKPAATNPTPDPDRWCWPHSEAMNTREIDTFTARLARFTDKGLELDDAEALADKLVMRDRDADDRRLCLECFHLSGQSGKAWDCRNWQVAKVASRARDAQLSGTLVNQPQRCDGFKDSN